MKTVNLRNPNQNAVLCLSLAAVLVLYITLQFVYAAGFISSSKLLKAFFAKPIPPPYIVFLASLITPKSGEIDRDCLWGIFRDRNIMWEVETILERPQKYSELQGLVENKFEKCIVRGPTEETPPAPNTTTEEATTENPDPPCFVQPDDLKSGPGVNTVQPPPTLEEVDREYATLLQPGGLYPGPHYCKRPRHSTAFIIPYRNRELHLRYWLHYTLGTLIVQQLYFRVIVVEQDDNEVFNKGQLMNTAFKWAISDPSQKWDCFVFHDVDMISEIYGTLYKCADEATVMHFAPYVDKFNYTTFPKVGVTVGGAVGFTESQYKTVNGYSNVYWGWGGEDDDMNVRIRLSGLKRRRPKQPFGRYKMVRHTRDYGNPTNRIRHKLLKSARARMAYDGLSSLATKITRTELHGTHTKLLVKVNTKTNPSPKSTNWPDVKKKN